MTRLSISRWGALKEQVFRIGPALVGQGLSFVAMLLPVVLGRIDEVAFLVAVGAIAGVTSFTFTWSYASVYPGITDEREASIATVASIGLLVLACVSMLALSATPGLLGETERRFIGWGSLLVLPQGLNLMINGLFVRNRNYPAIARLRLVSGISNFTLIAGACLLPIDYPPSLVIATALSFGLTSLWGLWKNREEVERQIFREAVRLREIWLHLRAYVSAAMAALLGGAAFHLAGIVVPRLGEAANSWAVAIRLAGGFSTVSQQVVGPIFETDFAFHLRNGARSLAAGNQMRAMRLGLLYAVGCAAVVCVIILYVGADEGLGSRDRLLVLAGAALFSFAILSTSLITRNLVIAGGQRWFFTWAAVKVSICAFVVFATKGVVLLVCLASIEAVFQGIYYILCRKRAADEPRAADLVRS